MYAPDEIEKKIIEKTTSMETYYQIQAHETQIPQSHTTRICIYPP